MQPTAWRWKTGSQLFIGGPLFEKLKSVQMHVEGSFLLGFDVDALELLNYYGFIK